MPVPTQCLFDCLHSHKFPNFLTRRDDSVKRCLSYLHKIRKIRLELFDSSVSYTLKNRLEEVIEEIGQWAVPFQTEQDLETIVLWSQRFGCSLGRLEPIISEDRSICAKLFTGDKHINFDKPELIHNLRKVLSESLPFYRERLPCRLSKIETILHWV